MYANAPAERPHQTYREKTLSKYGVAVLRDTALYKPFQVHVAGKPILHRADVNLGRYNHDNDAARYAIISSISEPVLILIVAGMRRQCGCNMCQEMRAVGVVAAACVRTLRTLRPGWIQYGCMRCSFVGFIGFIFCVKYVCIGRHSCTCYCGIAIQVVVIKSPVFE